MKMKARTVAGRGWKSLLCDPGSELRVGRRGRRRCAKKMNGMSKKKKKKKKCALGVPYCSYSQYTLSSWAFSGLTMYWPPVLQYSQYSDYGLFSSIFYCVCEVFFCTQSTKKHIFSEMYFVCAGFYSAGHNVIYRNLDITQLFVSTFTPQATN